jgi:hypothetical protein
MDQADRQDQPRGDASGGPADAQQPSDAPALEPSDAPASQPADAPQPQQPADAPPAPEVVVVPPAQRRAGRRIVGALVLLPWLLGYGSVGAWAVTFGARTMAGGHVLVDAGYTRMVTPGGVVFVGALLLAAFATLLAAAVLLVSASRRRGTWLAVAVAAAVLTAGAVWAGVLGELNPILWALFFFGLVDAFVVALVGASRASRRDRVLRP